MEMLVGSLNQFRVFPESVHYINSNALTFL
jgi:hypothetical protein